MRTSTLAGKADETSQPVEERMNGDAERKGPEPSAQDHHEQAEHHMNPNGGLTRAVPGRMKHRGPVPRTKQQARRDEGSEGRHPTWKAALDRLPQGPAKDPL